MKFNEWLATQREYQADTFGVDYPAMETDPERLTGYVTTNLWAAVHEIVEAGAETPWKPWATVDKGEVWRANREKFVGEVVDVLFFLGNALTAVNCTDEELATAYGAKMAVNRQRQAAGYDGKNKCASCGRALDEPGSDGSSVIDRGNGVRFCDVTCEENHV